MTSLPGEADPLSTAYPCNLLVTACSALIVTLWFLIVICIARLSAKSDPSTVFTSCPKVPLIATKKWITLSTPPVEFTGLSVCSVMWFFHFHFNPSLPNLLWWTFSFILVFQCSLVIWMLYFCWFSWYQGRLQLFSLFLTTNHGLLLFLILLLCFLKPDYLLYIFSLSVRSKPISCLSFFQMFYSRVYWLKLLV